MSNVFSKKNIASAFLAVGVVALTVFGATACTSKPDILDVHASAEDAGDRLKVFIGDIDRAPENYLQERAAYLSDAAETNAASEMRAVIGLGDYYAVEALTDLAADYDITVNRLYMWPKGETGRLSLYVENGDIQSGIEAYKKEVVENGYCEDEQFAKDYQRFLGGEYGVFALTVTATAGELETLKSEADCIRYIDPMCVPTAEAYADETDKTVTYIEFPSKPDGVG